MTDLLARLRSGAVVDAAALSRVDAGDLVANGLRLMNSDATMSNWARASLRNGWFINVSFMMSDLSDTVLEGATFVSCRFDNALLSGRWKGARFIQCSFVDANLSMASLAEVAFHGVFVGKKKPRWPKGPTPAMCVSTSEWMRQPSPPWLEWSDALKKGRSPEIDAWLKEAAHPTPAKKKRG